MARNEILTLKNKTHNKNNTDKVKCYVTFFLNYF